MKKRVGRYKDKILVETDDANTLSPNEIVIELEGKSQLQKKEQTLLFYYPIDETMDIAIPIIISNTSAASLEEFVQEIYWKHLFTWGGSGINIGNFNGGLSAVFNYYIAEQKPKARIYKYAFTDAADLTLDHFARCVTPALRAFGAVCYANIYYLYFIDKISSIIRTYNIRIPMLETDEELSYYLAYFLCIGFSYIFTRGATADDGKTGLKYYTNICTLVEAPTTDTSTLIDPELLSYLISLHIEDMRTAIKMLLAKTTSATDIVIPAGSFKDCTGLEKRLVDYNILNLFTLGTTLPDFEKAFTTYGLGGNAVLCFYGGCSSQENPKYGIFLSAHVGTTNENLLHIIDFTTNTSMNLDGMSTVDKLKLILELTADNAKYAANYINN